MPAQQRVVRIAVEKSGRVVLVIAGPWASPVQDVLGVWRHGLEQCAALPRDNPAFVVGVAAPSLGPGSRGRLRGCAPGPCSAWLRPQNPYRPGQSLQMCGCRTGRSILGSWVDSEDARGVGASTSWRWAARHSGERKRHAVDCAVCCSSPQRRTMPIAGVTSRACGAWDHHAGPGRTQRDEMTRCPHRLIFCRRPVGRIYQRFAHAT